MPTVQCPHCRQRIETDLDALAGDVYCLRCDSWFSPWGDRPAEGSTGEDHGPNPPDNPDNSFERIMPPPLDDPPPTHCTGCNKRLHNVVPCPACGLVLCSELCRNRHLKLCPVVLARAAELVQEREVAERDRKTRELVVSVVVFAVVILLCACGGLIFWPKSKGQDKAHLGAGTQAASKVTDSDPYPECGPVRRWLRENTGDPSSVEVVRWLSRTPTPAYGRANVSVKYRCRNAFGALQSRTRDFHVVGGRVVCVSQTY
jgi:hypothetical protein